jgi:hypothetical protein
MKMNYIFPGNKIAFLCLMIIAATCFVSCKKYLEAKPDQSIATPTTLADAEGLLDNYTALNTRFPSASEVSSDNYYLTDADWNSLIDRQRNFYLWQKFDDIGSDYLTPYISVGYANVILETVQKINTGELTRRNQVEGSALFIRGAYHFAIAQLFAKPYNQPSSTDDAGIALRLTGDAEEKPVRSTIAETYQSILTDLTGSVRLLSPVPNVKYHVGKAAAYGLIARVCLSMRDYKKAELYADSCLAITNKLINYNLLSTTATNAFSQYNDEVIWDARTAVSGALGQAKAKIDTTLFSQYNANDLRKTLFFKTNANGSRAFKGSYSGLTNGALFTGVATDEVYLTKAECAVRNGNTQTGLQYLNTLLAARWKTGTYSPATTTDPKVLLPVILSERRKELLFRGLRWMDLRRLNAEPDLTLILKRKINGQVYTLEPGSPRYVLQIDRNAVRISGLIQNP